jgi:hypothetical protein
LSRQDPTAAHPHPPMAVLSTSHRLGGPVTIY